MAAYAALDDGSRARTSQSTFAGLAQAAMSHVGFTPTGVGVIVTEKGDEATAVAVFRCGRALSSTRMVPHCGAAGRWGVVLRPNFGAEITKKG